MTTHPTAKRNADRAVDDRHGNGGRGANDLLLVFGVAAVALGVVLVCRGVLPSQPAADLIPSTHTALGRVERQVPAQDARVVATMPPTDRIPTASAPRTTSSGAPKVMAVCPARLDPDHDWRLVLAAMALQRRRSLQPMPHFVPPGKHDVPDSVLARTKGAVARAEASPPATRRPKAEDQVLGEADARVEVSPPAARRVNAPDC